MSKATGVWTLESWALVLVFAKCKPDLTYRVLSYGTVVRAVVLYSDPPSPGAPKETVSACSLRGHSPMSLIFEASRHNRLLWHPQARLHANQNTTAAKGASCTHIQGLRQAGVSSP